MPNPTTPHHHRIPPVATAARCRLSTAPRVCDGCGHTSTAEECRTCGQRHDARPLTVADYDACSAPDAGSGWGWS